MVSVYAEPLHARRSVFITDTCTSHASSTDSSTDTRMGGEAVHAKPPVVADVAGVASASTASQKKSPTAAWGVPVCERQHAGQAPRAHMRTRPCCGKAQRRAGTDEIMAAQPVTQQRASC